MDGVQLSQSYRTTTNRLFIFCHKSPEIPVTNLIDLARSSGIKSHLAHFQVQARKIKKIHPEKNSLYFQKWNFLALLLKKFLHFLKRKLFLYSQKWNPALFSPSSKNKKIYPKKTSYIFLKRKLFLCFRKLRPRRNSLYLRKLLIF